MISGQGGKAMDTRGQTRAGKKTAGGMDHGVRG